MEKVGLDFRWIDNKMKVLVLGKNGFIGRNLCEYFEKKEDIELSVAGSQELNLIDEEAVKSFISDNWYDVIINASIYNPRVGVNKKAEKELEYDLRMFHNLAKFSKSCGKMIYFGSGAEYDKRFPICSVTEDEIGNTIPVTDYGYAKYIIGREIDADMYPNIYNLRVFGLFGKYENWVTTFISGACCKALKDLPITIRRDVYFDYLYIDDFCRLVDRFIRIDKPAFHSYNICSGRRVRLTEIAETVKKVSGKDLPVYVCNEGLANEYTASNERLMNEISDYSLEDFSNSVSKLYTWYKDHEDIISIEKLLYGL